MAGDGAVRQDLRTALNELIARRARLGLGILAAGIVLLSLLSHAAASPPGRWSDGLNGLGLVLVAAMFALLSRPAGQVRPVPVALFGFGLLCALRTLGGIWGDDVVPTVLTCVTAALVVGGTMPWGVGPQVAAAAMAGAAIAVNAAVVLDAGADSHGRGIANVLTALGASVVLAYELRRNHARWFAEIFERRRMQDELARFNAELEQRVDERAAALAAATEQRRATERRLQDILDNAPAAIHVKDLAGRYILVNRRADAILAKPGASALGTTVHEAVPEAVADALLANDRAVLAQGAPLQFEEVMILDGVRHTFLSVKFPLYDASGAAVAVGGISTDITARKRTEEELRQAEARERAHQAELAHVLRLGTMGEMAASLAHEINQPLGAIANYAQGCVHRLRDGGAEPAAVLHAVEEIAREALRAGQILRRVRTLVRKEEPLRERLDLPELVRDAARIVAPEASRHGVAVQVGDAGPLPPVHGDPIQIEQVVINLLLNGLDAVVANGAHEARELVVTIAADGDAGIEVTVRDTGIGIPPDDVFIPFYSTKPGGLGMGLSISRSIIEAHGGQLTATRNPDRGSTFRFTLPADEA